MKLLLLTVALCALFHVNGVFGSVECGKVLLNKDNNNGKTGSTLEGQWPWQVSIYQQTSGNNAKYICGGTLISKRHVITAAHCAVSRTGRPLNRTVYLGKHNINDAGDKVQVSTINPKDTRVHPDFNRDTFFNNLAILELQDPVTFTDWVQPACLWPDSEIELKNIVGQIGSVAGFGTDETGQEIKELSLLEKPVVSQETCIRSYPDYFVRFTSASTYCAGSREACKNDSGGGMLLEKDGRWYLRGVLSLQVAKREEYRCDPTHFTIFADVAQVLSWIKENIKYD